MSDNLGNGSRWQGGIDARLERVEDDVREQWAAITALRETIYKAMGAAGVFLALVQIALKFIVD